MTSVRTGRASVGDQTPARPSDSGEDFTFFEISSPKAASLGTMLAHFWSRVSSAVRSSCRDQFSRSTSLVSSAGTALRIRAWLLFGHVRVRSSPDMGQMWAQLLSCCQTSACPGHDQPNIGLIVGQHGRQLPRQVCRLRVT